MKNALLSMITLLITAVFAANAQIPNSGFENWTTSAYDSLNGWASTNFTAMGSFYPVTKSTDHYPANVGSYSIRIESNTDLLPSYAGRGFVACGELSPYPTFPVTGHPNTLTGFYKFAPLNGDEMTIFCTLFLNGSSVAGGELTTTNTVSNWTSFTIPLGSYTSADSAQIILSTFISPGPQDHNPLGNSVLYVDNLNFDELITGVDEQISKPTAFSLYPNPASDVITISNPNNAALTLNIYNAIGQLMRSETISKSQQQINVSDLSNGMYVVEVTSKEGTQKQKLIIKR